MSGRAFSPPDGGSPRRLRASARSWPTGVEGVVAADDEEAAQLFERALALPGAGAVAVGTRPGAAAYGRRLRRGGDPRAARASLAAARETFEQMGAAPWVRACRSYRAR